MKWAAKDGETLVVVTADHETGGWALLGGDIASGTVKGKFATDDHSGVMVPVYSFGPKVEIFTGIFENTDLFFKMLGAYGFGDQCKHRQIIQPLHLHEALARHWCQVFQYDM